MITDSPVLIAALQAAIRAPSPHNTQPWLFELAPGVLDLVLDEDRVLEVCDPDGREARLACGAALMNIVLAIVAAGVRPTVDLLPERGRPTLLARVGLGGRRRPTSEQLRLAAAIPRRYSNRRPFADSPVPPQVRAEVHQAARDEGARLVLLDEAGLLEAVAGLVRRADHAQTRDMEFQAERKAWTRGHGPDDGVPTLDGGQRSAGGLLPVRHFSGSDQTRTFEQDPVVAVLTTPGDGPLAQVRAGRAMQRVLLTATASGLSTSFYTQPLEISSSRAELRALLGGSGYPQTVFWVGYGYPGNLTPRRTITEVSRMR